MTDTKLIFDFGTYEGEVTGEGGTMRHGQGTLTYKNGNIYQGNWSNGACDGKGVKMFANGDCYMGDWSQGKRQGKGEYRFIGGHKYNGEYFGDQCHGKGVLTTAEGDVFDGEWFAGKKHGPGVERMSTGQCFQGTWITGKKHGKGTTIMPDGEVVVGDWVADKCSEILERQPAPGSESQEKGTEETAPQPAAQAPLVGPCVTDEEAATLEEAGLPPEAVAAIARLNDQMTGRMNMLLGGVSGMEAQLDALTSALEGLENEEEMRAAMEELEADGVDYDQEVEETPEHEDA